jgi:hypothetical protein
MAHASSPFPVPVCTRLLLSVRTFGEGNSCRNKKSLQPLQVQQPLTVLVLPTLTWALTPVRPVVSGITWCKNQQLIFFLPVICCVSQKKNDTGHFGKWNARCECSTFQNVVSILFSEMPCRFLHLGLVQFFNRKCSMSPDASFQGSLGELDIHKS